VYNSGTLWCSGLIDCWYQVGREVMDKLVLDHHFALGTSATMADAANQIIQSDIDLYGGAHVSVLAERLGSWGFLDPTDFVPQITHTPLGDVEGTAGPYAVVATVTSAQPLTAVSPMLFWGAGETITDSVLMTPAGVPDQYTADIPDPGVTTDIRYYLRAVNTIGGSATHPSGAPGNAHSFHVDSTVTTAVEKMAPRAVALSPPAPSPSRGAGTSFHFAMPRAGAATLALYDVAGRCVRTIVDGTLDSGVHVSRWNGRDESGRTLRPGMYLVRLRANGVQLTQRLTVIR
jgi:hypothetical protein